MSAPKVAQPDDRVQCYLEAFATAGLNREIAQEEVVWSAMPLFLTAVGLLATALGTLLLKLPLQSLSPFSLAGGAVGLVAAALLGTGLLHIERAIFPRKYRYPPDEEKLCLWAEARRAYLEGHEKVTGRALENAVLRDLRAHVLSELSSSATNNRAHNIAKHRHRTKAIRRIFFSGLATLGLAAIVLSYNVTAAAQNAGNQNERRNNSPTPSASSPSASAAPSPGVGLDRESAHHTPQNHVGAVPASTDASSRSTDAASRPGPAAGSSH